MNPSKMFSVVQAKNSTPQIPKREYGNHLVLNHTKSRIQDKIEEPSNNLRLFMNFPDNFNLPLNTAFNQQQIGSCVANAFAAAVQIHTGNIPSRLYLYYNARIGCNICPNNDSGLDLGLGLPLLCSYGLPDESLFPYIVSQYSKIPPYKTYQSRTPQNITYNAIAQTEQAIKNTLYSGNPIIFGIYVYQSFLLRTVERTGIIPYPNKKKEQMLGGHCILMVGWTKYNNVEYFIIRNSWGTAWGNTGETRLTLNNGKNGGYAYIPKTYILDTILSFNFYALKLE